MRDLDWYLDEAKSRAVIASDRKLSAMLELSNVGVNNYRKRKALPNDETMIRLARIAGIDPFIALLDLNTWRSEGEAQKTYLKMLEKITAAIAIFIAVGAIAVPARAAPALPQNCQMENAIVYITENIEQGACGFGKNPQFSRSYTVLRRHGFFIQSSQNFSGDGFG